MLWLPICNLALDYPILGIFPVEYFDDDENSTESLTGGLRDNAQKINGLAGTTLATYVFHTVSVVVFHSPLLSDQHSTELLYNCNRFNSWLCFHLEAQPCYDG